MTDSTVSGNNAGQRGGGIFNTGATQLLRVTLDHNSAPSRRCDLQRRHARTEHEHAERQHRSHRRRALSGREHAHGALQHRRRQSCGRRQRDPPRRGPARQQQFSRRGRRRVARVRENHRNPQATTWRTATPAASTRPPIDPIPTRSCNRWPPTAVSCRHACPHPAARSSTTAAPAAPARISGARPGRWAPPATSALWRR